jgi:hypothetical protein
MLSVGQSVKVTEPFARDFPEIYTITEVYVHEDGQIVYILGEAGGFDIKYLEVVE